MTQEERIAQLEQENAELRAQLSEAYQQISQLTERLQRVKGQVAKDSSKPPSSDGPRRRPHQQRKPSEKPMGGQPGHTGGTLLQVTSPDEVVCHRPVVCAHCQQSLEGVAGQLKER